jgi:hypothetical protein
MALGISMGGGGGGGTGGVQRVADAAARLALSVSDGLMVIQLDTDMLYEYDLTTASWVIVGGVSPTFTDVLIKNSVQFEDPDAGTNKITMKASTSLAVDWTMTLPTTAGTNKYVLQTDGSGVTSWVQADLTAAVTGVLPLANGGTNKALTAGLGQIVYTDADSLEVLAAGTANQLLYSGGAAAPAWTTSVFPTGAITSPSVMVANTANTWTAVLGSVTGRFLRTSGSTISFQPVGLTSDVSGVLPIANGGSAKALTLAAGAVLWTDADSFEVSGVGTAGQALISGGTGAPTWYAPTATNILFAGTGGILASDTGNFTWDSTNHRMFAGTGGITVPRDNIHLDNGTATAAGIRFTAGTTTGTGTADGCSISILTTGIFQLSQIENLDMVFRTNNTQRMILKNTGSIQTNIAALATNATDGFLYINTSAGTPTGAPTSLTGVAPSQHGYNQQPFVLLLRIPVANRWRIRCTEYLSNWFINVCWYDHHSSYWGRYNLLRSRKRWGDNNHCGYADCYNQHANRPGTKTGRNFRHQHSHMGFGQ